MTKTNASGAVSARTRFVNTGGRTLAYRVIGDGMPFIWCNRFRGIMDSWDPAFIDQLAVHYQVIIFDYTGVGLSTGQLPPVILDVAKDVKDLIDHLGFGKVIIGGWSYGGLVAQLFSTHYPDLVSHTILIGTNPPGKNSHPAEPVFLETSSHVVNDFEDEVILFFEPESAKSRNAAAASHERLAARTEDPDVPVPEAVWQYYYQGFADYAADPTNARKKLGELHTPVLVLSGDHDIVCPVENWYALTRCMINLYLVVVPHAGHGPQHQYVSLSVHYIHSFIQHYED